MHKVTPDQLEAARRAQRISDLVQRAGVKITRHGHEWIGLCPFHTEKTPSFTVNDGKGFYHCFGCGAHGDAITWRIEIYRETFAAAVEALIGERPSDQKMAQIRQQQRVADTRDSERRRHLARDLWTAAVPIKGTPGEAYFRGRGIAFDLPPTLRFHPSLAHGQRDDRRHLPGVVAAVQDLAGHIVAVHRIYLDPASIRAGAAAKTQRSPDKALLGAPGDGAIRLAPTSSIGDRLGLCEGIETGLAVRQAMPALPVWAAIAANRLPAVALPASVTAPLILADRDKVSWQPGPMYGRRPGEYWAMRAATAFTQQGRKPKIAVPPSEKADFNDLLKVGAA